MEVDTGFLPLALDGPLADIPSSRNFRKGKSTKILQVDDLRERRFGLGEFVERFADASEAAIVNRVLDVCSEGGDLKLATALLSPTIPRMIDDQATHDPGGIAHESPTIGEGRGVFARHFDVRLVDEGDGAQADRPASPSKFMSREASQLRIERRKQRVCGRPISVVSCLN
jgi:hypothetical protein